MCQHETYILDKVLFNPFLIPFSQEIVCEGKKKKKINYRQKEIKISRIKVKEKSRFRKWRLWKIKATVTSNDI